MTNNNNKESTTVTEVVNVISIDKNYITDFFKNASLNDKMWILATMDKCIDDSIDGYYFPKFRTEFARHFHPELFSNSKKTKKLFSEELKKALESFQTAEKIKTPTQIVEISKKYVIQFYVNADIADKAWIYNTVVATENKGENFIKFRTDFARRFLPHLFKQKMKYRDELAAML